MFNNDSSTDLVMLTSPYHHHGAAAVPSAPMFNKSTSTAPVVAEAETFGAPQHQHPYLHQQRTIEIIELIEVPPPTRREHISVPDSSSYASSSCCSSEESEEEEEEAAESYCSSEEEDEFLTGALESEKERAAAHAAFQSRMRRIEKWRDAYAKAVGAEFGSHRLEFAYTRTV